MFKFLKDTDTENVSKGRNDPATATGQMQNSDLVQPESKAETETLDNVDVVDSCCLESSVSELHFQISKTIQFSEVQVSPSSGCKLKYIMVNHLLQSNFLHGQSNENVRTILGSTSDLVPGVYEGGFKIWECTFDLISYLDSHSDSLPLQGTQVLDLGCGAGLLGMYALCSGSNRVDFQDFNSEVINFITIPNCLLNFPDEDVAKCKFWGGSWKSMLRDSSIPDVKFDFVLTSETLYNLNYFKTLHSIFENVLKPGGSILIAAKTCYFGVGGGTKLFLNLVQEIGIFDYEIVQTFRTGIQREIIKLGFR